MTILTTNTVLGLGSTGEHDSQNIDIVYGHGYEWCVYADNLQRFIETLHAVVQAASIVVPQRREHEPRQPHDLDNDSVCFESSVGLCNTMQFAQEHVSCMF